MQKRNLSLLMQYPSTFEMSAAFLKPKVITLNSYKPKGVNTPGLEMFWGDIGIW